MLLCCICGGLSGGLSEIKLFVVGGGNVDEALELYQSTHTVKIWKFYYIYIMRAIWVKYLVHRN